MYEDNRVKKKSGQKPFYSMKSGKKRNRLDVQIMLIIGLVFLTGILVTFILKDDSPTSNMDNNSNLSEELTPEKEDLNAVPPVTKVAPLTAKEISTVKSIIEADSEGYLKLVNKENSLDENYKPENLIIPNVGLTKDRSNEQNLVRADIADDVESFLGDAEEAGYEIFLSSGYRSYNLQSILYKNDLRDHGYESGYVAKAGTSEHQLGLAIDITSHSVDLELTDNFENTSEGQWALENAHKYGFILRYKAEKEDITGYKYEPWHFRYVGDRTISKLCYEKNLTLEELMNCVNDAQ